MALMCCAGLMKYVLLLQLLDHSAVLLPATAAVFVVRMLWKGTWGRGRALCSLMFWSRSCAVWQTLLSHRGYVHKSPVMPTYPVLLMCWPVRCRR